MQLLKRLFNYYLDASMHVALAVVSLMGITGIMLNISLNFHLCGFAFFGTVVCYNFVKYGVEAKKYLIVSNVYHQNIQIISFLGFGASLYFFLNLEKELWLSVIVLGLISTLYAIPLMPNAKNLRSLGGFKIFIVALVWTGFTVMLPVLDAETSFTLDVWLLLVQRFVLILILILPFEIRDMEWDDKNLKTLPQVFGAEKTRSLGFVLIIFFFFSTFLKGGLTKLEIASNFSLSIMLILAFLRKEKMGQRYFASFWIEGIPVAWLGLTMVMKHFF